MSYNRIVIYPYNLGSQGARELAHSLGTKCVRPNGTYVVRLRDCVVNWGSSGTPNWWNARALAQTLNKPAHVSRAADKILAFQAFEAASVPCVPFTTSRQVALGWLDNVSYGNALRAVVCRTLTRASEGRGIVLARAASDVVHAPLYTRYVPKQAEYRVHMYRDGSVIDVQQKKRQNGFQETGDNKYLRNHHNGWVFCRQGVQAPQAVISAAEAALHSLGLDFGAVDVGYHVQHGAFVYEVNTAPGIEGQTVTNYANKFRSLLG